jgi:hypothetical protein
MKRKLGIVLSVSVLTFSGFGMDLQEDAFAFNIKNSAVTLQAALQAAINGDAEQMAIFQELLEAKINNEAKINIGSVSEISKTIEIIKRNISYEPLRWQGPFPVDLLRKGFWDGV